MLQTVHLVIDGILRQIYQLIAYSTYSRTELYAGTEFSLSWFSVLVLTTALLLLLLLAVLLADIVRCVDVTCAVWV